MKIESNELEVGKIYCLKPTEEYLKSDLYVYHGTNYFNDFVSGTHIPFGKNMIFLKHLKNGLDKFLYDERIIYVNLSLWYEYHNI